MHPCLRFALTLAAPAAVVVAFAIPAAQAAPLETEPRAPIETEPR